MRIMTLLFINLFCLNSLTFADELCLHIGDNNLESVKANLNGNSKRDLNLIHCEDSVLGTAVPLLGFTVLNERTDILKELLKNPSLDLNQKSKDGFTPLYYAALSGNSESVEELLRAGADLKSETPLGATALSLAAAQGHSKVVQLLVEMGSPLDHKSRVSNDSDLTPLHLAMREGHLYTSAVLISLGAGQKARSKKGLTPLEIYKSECSSDSKKFVHGICSETVDERIMGCHNYQSYKIKQIEKLAKTGNPEEHISYLKSIELSNLITAIQILNSLKS